MKLKTLKPLYLGGQVLTEGRVFVTDEQHGRELLAKAFAEAHAGDDDPELELSTPSVPVAPLTSDQLVPPVQVYKPHHKGGGKWVVLDAAGEDVGDFSGNREEAAAEAERLNAPAGDGPSNPPLPQE